MAQQPRSTISDPSPVDTATVANPYPRYQHLREEDPVHWNQGISCEILSEGIIREGDIITTTLDLK